ncbi:NUDIX domain-containing protein [Chitinophaga sedimenti]|uniref:NUDIX domain-containing protein n=1 Tax=Chitinophaga sedimenti TaxID=2033606 RepID=UPI0020054694|nr:NUDIX domain-containing protein [Chitinophaga sedimenti]MCK7556743.1 NUDIX domain-containing protein [Chitinophaga sedimenti]
MKTTGVIIARFQTPYLHEGHRYLINEIRAKHNKVVVLLGVTPVKGSRRNPFDFYTREKLLKQFCPELVVLPLSDHPSDAVWSQQLDSLLDSVFPQENFVLYGSRSSFAPYYSGRLPVELLPEQGDHSATAIRDGYADKVLESQDFRMGINYAYQNVYAKVYPTVDIALLHNNKVLLGKKHNASVWRFPGGFTDPTDESYEAAAARELREECGELETTPMQYIGSVRVDDWRYRSEVDKIITSFYKTNYTGGEPKASDDLAEVAWFDLTALPQITPEHEPLVKLLLTNLNVDL